MLTFGAARPGVNPGPNQNRNSAEVKATVTNYIEAYYAGDAERTGWIT